MSSPPNSASSAQYGRVTLLTFRSTPLTLKLPFEVMLTERPKSMVAKAGTCKRLKDVPPAPGAYAVRGRLDTKVSPDAPFTIG